MPTEERSFKIVDTTATKKIFELKQKIRAVAGGTSASKTISILIWCIDYAQTHREEVISVVSESFPHLRLGAILDFKNIMKDRGYWRESQWNESNHFYQFETGTILEFFSSDAEKAHGPRRDVLFLNEAQHLPFNEVDQLIVRTRKIVWMDWNPTTEFWFYTDIKDKRDDVDFITLTYKDNEALDTSQVKEIESRKGNKNWWPVYGLGQLGTIQGAIYTNWKIIDELPMDARLERRYLDYGYSNDPTAIGDIYRWNNAYVLDEILYQKGLSNKQIADVILNQSMQVPVAADSAEPKSNDELAAYGITILPAKKGPDSVNYGIQLAQKQTLWVTKRSVNIIKELRSYLWMTDKNGVIINVPIGIWNHHMDGMRYGFVSLIEFISENVFDSQSNRMTMNERSERLRSTR